MMNGEDGESTGTTKRNAHDLSERMMSLDVQLENLLTKCSDLSILSKMSGNEFVRRQRIIQAMLCEWKANELKFRVNEVRDFVSRMDIYSGLTCSLKQAYSALDAFSSEFSEATAFVNHELRGHAADGALPLHRCVRIPNAWCRGDSIEFELNGSRYRTIPPSGSRPGDLVEFDPHMRTLCILNSELS